MGPALPLPALTGWLALALGAASLEGERERRIAAAGQLGIGLALAAWRAVSGEAPGPLVLPRNLGQGFVAVNGALLLLGTGLMLRAAVPARSGRLQLGAAIAIVAGGLLIVRLGIGFVVTGGVLRVMGAALALGVAGTVLVFVARRLDVGREFRAVERRRPREPVIPRSPSRILAGSLVLGTLGAALGPHLAGVFLGVIAAGWSAFLLSHEPGRRPLPVVPVLTLLLLPVYWFLTIIAGPEGLGIEALPLLPLSPAAESLVAPTLLLVGWSLAGLWPLHRQVPGALTVPAGALLLIRVALPLARGGLEYLRPLAAPLAVLGIWHAAAVGRWRLVAVGAAFLGIASATRPGVAGAGWLLGCALVLELASWLHGRAAARRAAEAAAWLAGAWGGLMVLEGALRGEVVYTALGALGLALIVVAPRSPSEAATSASAR